jgi:hypothetical protein
VDAVLQPLDTFGVDMLEGRKVATENQYWNWKLR